MEHTGAPSRATEQRCGVVGAISFLRLLLAESLDQARILNPMEDAVLGMLLMRRASGCSPPERSSMMMRTADNAETLPPPYQRY